MSILFTAFVKKKEEKNNQQKSEEKITKLKKEIKTKTNLTEIWPMYGLLFLFLTVGHCTSVSLIIGAAVSHY